MRAKAQRFTFVLAALAAWICAGCDPNNLLARLAQGAGYCDEAAIAAAACCAAAELAAKHPRVCGLVTAESLGATCADGGGLFGTGDNTLSAADAVEMDCQTLLTVLGDVLADGDDDQPDGDPDGDADGDCPFDGAPCSDGDPCTENDVCDKGECKSGEPKDCSGLDTQCRVGVCEAGECIKQEKDNGEPCDDDDKCTVEDQCTDGVCGGEAKTCDDENPCSIDACDPADGECRHDFESMENEACEDGDPCTAQERCLSGVCTPGGATDCSGFGDDCNEGVCGESGCEKRPLQNGLDCDDESLCTSNDACQDGVCTGLAADCADTNPCTVDGCDPSTGECLHDEAAANGQGCDDLNLCTEGDVCLDGVCQSGGPKDCSFLNTDCAVGACAAGVCLPQSVQDGVPCDDLDACTEGDKCRGGLCSEFDSRKTCDDQNECTVDSCNSVTGACSNVVNPNTCLISGRCYANGTPNPAEPICAVCDTDANHIGWTPINEGGDCSSSLCHVNDRCEFGQCYFDEKECNTDDPCRRGMCNLGTGECEYTTEGQEGHPCDDQEEDTYNDSCDSQGGCAGTEPPFRTHLETGSLNVTTYVAEPGPAAPLCVRLQVEATNSENLRIDLISPQDIPLMPPLFDHDSEAASPILIERSTEQYANLARTGVWTLTMQVDQADQWAELHLLSLSFASCQKRSVASDDAEEPVSGDDKPADAPVSEDGDFTPDR
ncbi:MAG: hypothetical protein C4523_09070 [Myxococcales bacterium]|nr:MAG: hypothetical protein C4523_09070 [Myxococcales bacterium]